MNENYPKLSSGEKVLFLFFRIFCCFSAVFLLMFLPWSGYWANPEGFYKIYVVVMPILNFFLLLSSIYIVCALGEKVFAIQLTLFIHILLAVIIGAGLLVIFFQSARYIDDLFNNFDDWKGMIYLTAFLILLLILIISSARVLVGVIKRSRVNELSRH